MSQTYPAINGVSPKLMHETDYSDTETIAKRAIYEFDSYYVTITPNFKEVSDKDELREKNVDWILYIGEDINCTDKTVGPFATVEKSVDFIQSNLDD